MGKFDHILIVTDLDFTFLGEKSQVVDQNIIAVKRFLAEGGKFTVATGRRLYDVKRSVPMIEEIANAPAILANGTVLGDVQSGEELVSSLLDFDETYEVVRYLRTTLPHIGLRVTTAKGFLTDEITVSLRHDCPPDQLERYRVIPLDRWEREPWYKVVCRATPEETFQFKDVFLEQFGDRFHWCHSEKTIFEFQNKDANKGIYLEHLREYYRKQGMEMKVYACGDYENDMELLRAADVAVCPANALDSVKDICDLCLCDHKQGVIADLIELLEREYEEGK